MAFHYRWFSHDEELTDEFGVRHSRALLDKKKEPAQPTKYARGEIASMIVALAALGYGIWTGIGALGAVLVGIIAFQEPVTAPRLIFLALLLVGIVGLKLTA